VHNNAEAKTISKKIYVKKFVIKDANIVYYKSYWQPKAQQTGGHIQREIGVWKLLKSLKFLFGTLIPTFEVLMAASMSSGL
jgi:hypothetical protein